MLTTTCRVPGCRTIVMGGGRCLAHEPHVDRVFSRGRPYVAAAERLEPLRQREAVALVGLEHRPSGLRIA